MLSRALNNPNIPTEKRMSAKDFFNDRNECKLNASIHWSQPLILEEEEEEKIRENLMDIYLEDFFQS